MKLPAWVRACDALSVAAAVLGLFAFLFGGFSLTLGTFRVPLRSPAELWFVAAACIAIRHTACPRDPLHRRLSPAARRAATGPAAVPLAALVSRLAVLAVAYFAVLTIGLATPDASADFTADPMTSLPARFDAGWYAGIAQDGYAFQGRFDRQQNVAFFPAFPMLMRAAGHLNGSFDAGLGRPWRMARTVWAGVVISLAAFAWAAVYVVRLARDTIGEDRASTALALLAAYPFAVFFSAPYTESLYLLGAVAAFYHFRRGQWAIAGAWGLLVGLTRPNGCFLSVALVVLLLEGYLHERRVPGSNGRSLLAGVAAAAAPGIGMLLYSAYVHQVTGSWFGWARLHETWGRTFRGLGALVPGVVSVATTGPMRLAAAAPFDALNALGFVFALAMVWPVTRRLGAASAVLILITIVPPFLAGGVLSMGRITSTLFPMFIALAAVLPRRFVTPTVTAFAVGQGFAAALFFTWRPLF